MSDPIPRTNPDHQPEHGLLGALSREIEALAEDVARGVVGIRIERPSPVSAPGYGGQSTVSSVGSGVLLSRTGFIVTAAHVIARADVITVTTPDGLDHQGHVVGRDESHDLGLIRIDGEGHHPMALSDVGASPGMFVVAVGRPPRTGFVVSYGIVSALDRATRTPSGQLINELVQTTAAVEPGVSGGAIADNRGRLLGVVTSATDSGGAISFAIGTLAVRNAITSLIPESAGIESPLMPPPII